jgi:hypothetical protein
MRKWFVVAALFATMVLSLSALGLAQDAKKPAAPAAQPAVPAAKPAAPAAQPAVPAAKPAMPAGMPEGTPPMGGPPKELAACADKVGTWDVATDMRMDPNAPFTQSTGVCVDAMVAGGAALQSSYTSSMGGMQFEGMGLTSYNTGTSKWMTTWVDNMGGTMSVYTGGMEGDKMVLSGTDQMMGQVWQTRITEGPVKDGKYDFMIEHSTDNGKTWAVFMKSVYTKRK